MTSNQSSQNSLTSSNTLRFAPHFLFITVFLIVLTLYMLTLAPGVVGGDAGEHQLAAPLLGIPHTTGYPLYILLGKLWTLILPFDSPAWQMNLFSAVTGALAAAVTALIVYYTSRSVTSAFPGALIAGLTLACGLTMWQWSTIAGVRAMNILFFALLTFEAILWQKSMETWRHGGMKDNPNPPTLHWLALTVGLSLAHHRTTIFYLPALIGWIGWHDRSLLRQPKRLLPLIVLTLAPLLLYLFIYIRGLNNPPYSHERITDLASFWFLVGSGDSSGLFLSLDPAYLPAKLVYLWNDLLTQLSWPGVILAVVGGVWLLLRRFGYFLFQTVLILLLLLFTLDFEVVNLNEAPAWYLMPAFFILATWVGVGINVILDLRFTSVTLSPRHLVTQISLTILFIALLAYSLMLPNWHTIYTEAVTPLDEWRQLLRGRQAERLVESSLPNVGPNSIIWGDWEQYTPFKYYQLINGWRPDVTVRNPLNLWPEKAAAAHAANQPIYFTRKTADLVGTPYLTMVGPLIYLQTAPQFSPPTDLISLNANFEDELELMGYKTKIWPQGPQPFPPPNRVRERVLQLTLYWRMPHQVQWDYALSLRLLDSTGEEIYKRDATHPVLSSYPTTLWTPGEVVGDFYELPLPANSTPLTVWILPYRTEGPGQWHNLTLTGTNPPQEGFKLNIEP